MAPRKFVDVVRKYAFEYGPNGTCDLCGGAVEVSWVRMECPPRPLLNRVAFRIARRFGIYPSSGERAD